MPVPGPEDITRVELPNGIVVLTRENRSSLSIVLSGYLPVGARDERRQQAGLADFTASALMRGTEKRPFAQIYEDFESVGAGVGIGGGIHSTGFGCKSLAEDFPLVLDILSEALRRPTFPLDQVEKLRSEILTDLQERSHDTGRMSSLVFRELAYPEEHPYSRSPSGYPETIGALTRDDLVAFYSGGYGPEKMVITIVGAISADSALAQVDSAFGDWKGQSYERVPLPQVTRIDRTRERYVSIPGKRQSDISLGYPGPARTDSGFLDAALCNSVLGIFGLMGRLGERIREDQGLAYYAFSRLSGGPGPGPWRVIAGVDPSNVEPAIDSIRSELRLIREELVCADDLTDNKSFVTGSLPLRLETNEGVAGALLDMERYGLGLDYLQRHDQLINEIGAESVRAAARQWLDPDAYALAVAGPPKS